MFGKFITTALLMISSMNLAFGNTTYFSLLYGGLPADKIENNSEYCRLNEKDDSSEKAVKWYYGEVSKNKGKCTIVMKGMSKSYKYCALSGMSSETSKEFIGCNVYKIGNDFIFYVEADPMSLDPNKVFPSIYCQFICIKNE